MRSKMGCRFSKPVPKPPEPTLPRSTTRAVHGESPNAGRVRDSAEFADLAGGVQVTNSECEVQATAESGIPLPFLVKLRRNALRPTCEG